MLILALWIQSLPGYTQTDSAYCLTIQKARLLISDAMKTHLTEELLTTSQERVALLESEKTASYKSFTNLLNISQQKFQKQKEITSGFVRLSDSRRQESDYYQKRSKKYRRQRNGLAAGLVVVIVISLFN